MALSAGRHGRGLAAWVGLALALGAARRGAAQTDAGLPPPPAALPGAGDAGAGDAGREAPPRHLLAPPSAIEMPAIAYPPDAPPLAAPAEVEVILTVDDQGAVTGVEVTRSAGPAVDRTVVEGVKRFRFHPATQDGVPIAVRLPFTQRFEPPPPPPHPAPREPELDAVIEGLVVTRGTRAPVAGAAVAAIDVGSGRQWTTVTDATGIFALPVLSGRALEVRVAAPQHERFVQSERLARDQRLRVKYLVDRKSYGQYESYVRAESDRTEVSRTTLSGPEITRIPGTFGDPFRVINVLPGVSMVSGLLPLPIVRGNSPGTTGILLDGVRLPLLFHLLAGPSVIHPELIDHVDFYPGGFPVTYGGYTGGIVDGVTRAARPGERRIDIDLNLTQTGGLVREPIAPLGATATLAGRIGYPGLVLGLLAPNVSLSYWDYQARFDGGNDRNRWVAFFYGAQDELQRRLATGQPLTTVAKLAFHRMDFRYQHGGSDSSELYRVVFGYDDSFVGGNNDTQIAGDTGLGNGIWSVSPQLRIHRQLRPWLGLDFGGESFDHSVENPPPAANLPTTPLAMNVSNLFNPNGFYTATGGFVQAVLVPRPRLRIIPGVRADVYDERLDSGGGVTQTSVDPRLLGRYRLTEAARGNVWLKGVVGRYHQPPRLFVPVPGLEASSLQLGLLASTQYSVGAEASLGKATEIDVSTYYNSMDPILFDLVVNPAATSVQQPQPTVPPGRIPATTTGEQNQTLSSLFARRVGRSYGIEVLLRRRESDRLFGWISYTLSRSQRVAPQGGWELFDFDRLHVLNLVAGLRLPRNWEVGGRVLYQTGTPLTTVFGTNVARSDPQFRLDLRLDKRAVWNRWLLDFYVDIINTTVAAESGGIAGGQSFRYIVPTLGVRGVL